MKRALLFGAGFALLTIFSPVAKADVGGQVPGPGLCDYPGVGASGNIMGVYHFYCKFPTEENGSNWIQIYGGAMVQGSLGVSAGLGVLNLQTGVTAPVGALEGGSGFFCPDGWLSDPPNPPGAWKNYLAPRPCKSHPPLPPPPDAEPVDNTPPAPPFPSFPGMPAPPPPPQIPDAFGPPPLVNPVSGQINSMPAVTNPDVTNPLQPQNPSN